MTRHIILRILGKLMIPLVLLFALYVQFHGDFGPGGGFQAGVIFGAGIILYILLFGLEDFRRAFSPRVVEILVAAGVFLYGAVGLATMILGGNFLDYDRLSPQHTQHGQHYGILLVELGVGITVTGVMIALFYCFAGRKRQEQ